MADIVLDTFLQCPIFFFGLGHATDTSPNNWTRNKHFPDFFYQIFLKINVKD